MAVISSIFPSSGPQSGMNLVTLLGTGMGTNGDVVSVTLASVVATIIQQTPRQIIVKAQASGQAVSGPAVIISPTTGTATSATNYAYNPTPIIQQVSPNSIPLAGQVQVTIVGSNQLGNGSDITSVTLSGVPVNSIEWQNATMVIVMAASTSTETSGAVIVNSTSFGGSVFGPHGFTYNAGMQLYKWTMW